MAANGRLPHFLCTSDTAAFARAVRCYGSWNSRTLRIAAASVGLSPTRLWERLRYRDDLKFAIDPEPVFIIGHWQAGHSVIHNLLAADPQFATVQLRHAIAPSSFRTLHRTLGRRLAKKLPADRGVDGLPSGLDSLQGDDFLLAGLTDLSIYHAYVFPQVAEQVFERSLLLKDLHEQELDQWLQTYRIALTRVAAEQGRTRVLSRNASNTARMPQLLELFPKAKFIHVFRNPDTVFALQANRWRVLTQKWSVQQTDTVDFRELSLCFYERMMRKYFADRSQLPPNQLCEVRYEDVAVDPVAAVQRIYNQLELGDCEAISSDPVHAGGVVKQFGGHDPRSLSDADRNDVAVRWAFAFEEFDYPLPTLAGV